MAVVAMALAAPQQDYVSDNLARAIELMKTLSVGVDGQSRNAEDRAKDYQTTAQSLELTLSFLQQLSSVWNENVARIQ